MTDVQSAWVGAMVEAEGSVMPGVGVSLVNTDIEIISTLLRFVGDGTVHYIAASSRGIHGRKPLWDWRLRKRASVAALLPQIAPYLTSKRPA